MTINSRCRGCYTEAKHASLQVKGQRRITPGDFLVNLAPNASGVWATSRSSWYCAAEVPATACPGLIGFALFRSKLAFPQTMYQ